ncbi:MAG: tetratricopeptide repeat protein [Planctomycetota bacterium]
MKDRQAELETNIVADSLGRFFKKIEPHSKFVLAGIVGIVVLLIAFGLYTNGQTAKRSDATLQLLMDNPEVATLYPDTTAAAWSLLFQANNDLANGVNALYENRDEAESLLTQAAERYGEAIKASDATLVQSRANYGIAIAMESLGKLDEAIEAYEKVIAANESEEIVGVAEERLDRLNNPEAGEFLAWFSDQDFAEADPSLPPSLPGAGGLSDLPDLELPDLELPDLELPEMGEPGEPIEGGIEMPADGDGDGSETADEPPVEAAEDDLKLEMPDTGAAVEPNAEVNADANAESASPPESSSESSETSAKEGSESGSDDPE